MDLTQGLLESNKTIGNINPIGHFMEGAKSGLDIQRAQMENEKTRYNQDQQYKLQQAIQQSVNEKGDIDYEALGQNGAKLGVSPQVIDYAIKTLPAQWDAIQKTAQSKRQLQVTSPEGYKQAQESAGASGWRSKPAVPTQSSSNAVAVPAPKQGEDKTGFTTPDMVNPQDSGIGYSVKRPEVTGEGGSASATTIEPTMNPAALEGNPQDTQNAVNTEMSNRQQNMFDIGNKMGVSSPFGATGGAGGGAGVNVPGVTDYTLPENTYTDASGKIQTYSDEELARNPQLNRAKAAENFFRSRTGDNTSSAVDTARNYLNTVRQNALAAEGVPFPPVYPMSATPEAIDKYNEEYRTWQNQNAQAIGKADKAVNEVKEAVAKGQYELADKLQKNQEYTIKINDKEYRAYNTKGRDGVSSLLAVDKIREGVSGDLATLKTGDYSKLNLLLPQVARVMAMSINPGSDVSMGSLAEVEATAKLEEGKKMGLGVEGALAALADWLSQKIEGKKTSFLKVAKNYLSGAVKQSSTEGIATQARKLLHEAGEASETFKKANLIGYDGSVKKENPKFDQEGPSAEKPLTEFPTSGWYNKPYNPKERIGFTSASGKKYEVENPGKDAFGNQKPYSVVHDAEGKKYDINPSSTNPDSVIISEQGSSSEDKDWRNKPAKAKKDSKPPVKEITRKAGESYADFLRRKAKAGK